MRTASGGKRATQTSKMTRRSSTSGAIRTTDVNKARASNWASKNVERRNAAGLNGKNPRGQENSAKRLARAESRVLGQARKGPMSNHEKEILNGAKGDLATRQKWLKDANKAKKQAKGPVERLKAQSNISSLQLGVSKAKDRVTRINAQPSLGAPITGRGGSRGNAPKAVRPNSVRGKAKRDPSARFKAVASANANGLNLDAGKYKRVYAMNANKADAAARRRR